jgi:hypothetical protein
VRCCLGQDDDMYLTNITSMQLLYDSR